MNPKPYLIYLVVDDEDIQLQLWRAFSKTQPDCLLYGFETSADLLEHLAYTQDKPNLIIISVFSPISIHSEIAHYLRSDYRLCDIPMAVLCAATSEVANGQRLGSGFDADLHLQLPTNGQEAIRTVMRLRSLWTQSDSSSMPRFPFPPTTNRISLYK